MGDEGDANDTDETHTIGKTRRRFLRSVGAGSAVAAFGGSAIAQETTEGQETTAGDQETRTEGEGDTQTTTAGEATPIALGGRVDYWLGLAPTAIEGQQNPTLQLRAGEQYRLTWVNLDGERHRWQIEDEAGNPLQRTDPARRFGATRTVTFEATEEMAQYRCEYHPERMQGTVELGEGFETTEGETTETTEGDGTATGTDGATVDVAVGPEDNTLRFVPEEVEISGGDTVSWTARSPGHNVSCKPEADRRVELPEDAEPFATYEGNRSFAIMEVGETFEHTFTVPGTYVYVCVPHAGQGMIGRVVVGE